MKKGHQKAAKTKHEYLQSLKGECYLHAIPSEAETAEVAAQLASKHDAIAQTVAELTDKLNEVAANDSEVAKAVGAFETTEF